MIQFLRRLFSERPSVLAKQDVASPSSEAVLDVPAGFTPDPSAPPATPKQHYDPPLISQFRTADEAVIARVITEHDHDGIDIHRRDAKRGYLEADANIYYTHFRDDGYSMGGVLDDGRSVHQTTRSFQRQDGAVVIASLILTFDEADDPRAVAIIRAMPGLLNFAG